MNLLPEVSEKTIRLPELHAMQCGKVTALEAADDDANRLMSMGVCIGRRVELVKAGDPLILRVLGSRIGLSARLARQVLVQPCESPACAGDS